METPEQACGSHPSPEADTASASVPETSEVVLPLIVKLTAALFIIGAGISIAHMIFAPLLKEQFFIDFTPLLTIPVGYGLLNRNEPSRSCATTLAMLCIINLLIIVSAISLYYFGVFSPAWPVNGMTITEIPMLHFWGLAFGLFLLLTYEIWAWIGLARKSVKKLFRHEASGINARSWVWALLFVGFIIGFWQCFTASFHQQEMKAIQYVDAEVRLVDDETGKGLQSLGVSPTTSESFKQNSKTPDYYFDHEKSTVHFQGLITRPITYSLGSNGYEYQKITIEPGTSTHTLRLVRTKEPVTDWDHDIVPGIEFPAE